MTRKENGIKVKQFLSSGGTSCRRVSVCPSQTGVVSKRLDESSWFLARRLPIRIPHCVIKEICVPSEISYRQKLCIFKSTSLWDFAPNSGL